METIKEIVRVVTSKADIKKVFPELVDPDGTNTITANFVRGLIDNDYSTDDEAAEALYGEDRSDQRYRTLKSRIYDRLLVALLNLQVKQPEHSLYLSMYYKCSRNSVASQTLMRFASRKAGAQLAERTLQIADKFNFTELQISLLYALRTTVVFQRNLKLYSYYHKRLTTLLEVQRAELQSEHLLDLFLLGASTRFVDDQPTPTLEESIDVIGSMRDLHQTNMLNLNYFRIKLFYAENTQSFQEIVICCNEALEYFDKYPHFRQPARMGEFTLLKAIACSSQRDFTSALEATELCIESFTEGGSNWYLSLDVAFVAAMNAGRYDEAIDYYVSATTNKRFSLQPEVTKERWKTYAAYLVIADNMNLHRISQAVNLPNFRLTSYLNSVPEFSKEKRYSNYLIIVSHICLLIGVKQFDSADRRIEYLRTYSHRYLKESQFERARIFVRFLTTLTRHFHDVKGMAAEAVLLESELRKLLSTPMTNEVNEIVPYEVLMATITEHLSTESEH